MISVRDRVVVEGSVTTIVVVVVVVVVVSANVVGGVGELSIDIVVVEMLTRVSTIVLLVTFATIISAL